MTPQEFQMHWANAGPIQPRPASIDEFDRAQPLTHHCIEVDERLPAMVMWVWEPAGLYIDSFGAGRTMLRLTTVVDGHREYIDTRLDCGLSESLGKATWGNNWFARTLAQFDEYAE